MGSGGTRYEIRLGRRRVSTSDASTPAHALNDFLRGLGCRDDEVRRIRDDTMSWRGAVYRAVPMDEGDA